MSDPSPAGPEPFYRRLDESGPRTRVWATGSTAGPWFADAQHLGPPSALLARALERAVGRADLRPARLAVDVLGPVPLGELEVDATVTRSGRTVTLATAELTAGGRPVARAGGWFHGVVDTAGAEVGRADPIPGPAAGAERERPEGWLPGYLTALEWRWLDGGLELAGPARVWARLRVPLVADEEPSAAQRVAAVADSTNGAGARLDARRWLFLNTDLTLHLHRTPVGEWVGLDADAVIGPEGLGTASAVLHDPGGPVGRAAQALTVRPR